MPRGLNDYDTGKIQGRNVSNADSASIVSPGLITDGLVLHLDAGNFVSYPAAGTTWQDLSNKRNTGTLINGPAFSTANGGNIFFDGVNDYASISGSTTVSQATFSVWLKRNGTQISFAGILFSRGSNVSGFNYFLTNTLGYHWNDAAASYGFNSGLTPPDGAWSMCVLVVTSTAAIFYLCQSSGITTATNTLTHASTTIDALTLGFGSDSNNNRYVTGNVAQASIYGRALSEPEINQNFNATRARFGI